MTGVSSGLLRGGSYGSLQTHGSGQNGAMQSQNSFNLRKPSKSVLWGTREKERFLPCMYRYLGRRKIGMLILAVFALLAFMSGLFTINGDDASRSAHLIFERLRNTTYRVPSTLSRVGGSQKDTNSSLPSTMAICSESVFHPPIPRAVNAAAVTGFAAVHEHPCKDFALSPPPSGDRRHTGPRPCPVCYLPVEKAIASMPSLPSVSPVLHNLTYFQEENPIKTEPHGGSDFGGYPSLKQRNDSFNIEESMTVHCGFVKGCIPGQRTGFDIKEADLRELEQYYEVIVASAIFDKYDVIQQPTNVSDTARKNIPFFMFVDEETEAYIKNTSVLDSNNKVGLWRLIVVHNVPYNDGRRNGKIPKLLLHRLFPNVRYSIWVDGKLELVVDPYQVLERFLWRENATFAISRHYTRFDVFEEAEANKAAGKVENSSIDFQIEFYRKEGLTPYFDAKLPPSRGTSDVPEGCVIIREHIPITNLFTCLWFNEVDRFTSRDQLSFSTVRDKIMDKVPWSINMFMDCERRNFVVQAYHRELLEQRARAASAMPMIRSPPAGGRDHTAGRDPIKKNSTRRGKGRRHRKVNPGSKGNIAG